MLFSFQRPTKLPRRFGFSLSRSPPGEAADSTYFESTVKRKFRENFEAVSLKKAGFSPAATPAPDPHPASRTADTARIFLEHKRNFRRAVDLA